MVPKVGSGNCGNRRLGGHKQSHCSGMLCSVQTDVFLESRDLVDVLTMPTIIKTIWPTPHKLVQLVLRARKKEHQHFGPKEVAGRRWTQSQGQNGFDKEEERVCQHRCCPQCQDWTTMNLGRQYEGVRKIDKARTHEPNSE